MDEQGKAKYMVLMEGLREDILSGHIKSGEKLPSENELSEKFQISRHTIRKALSILANEGFVTAEHGKGTFCTRRIRNRGKSHNIAVITTYMSDYIFPRLIQGIDRVLTEQGYSIILKNTGNSRSNEEKALQDILTKNIDGVIIEPSKSQILCKHMNLYELLDEYDIPYVFIQGIYPQMQEKPHILMDDCEGGYLLTKHLIETGKRHIGGIFKADDFQGIERHRGYVKALQEAGILYNPQMVIWFHTEDRKSKPSLMVKQMLDRNEALDGLICYNDQIALDIRKTLDKRGVRIPEDVAITGYDNSAIAKRDSCGLTTIAHPQEELGEMAAKLLLEQIQKVPEEESKVERLVKPVLIIRESTQK